jgi:preprotein translocase subunit SecA
LEYDDVMNKQRNVIYTKRHHALFGERLSGDIDNAMFDLCQIVLQQHQESGNYAEFKLNCMVQFSIDPSISETQFKKENADDLAHQLYTEVKEHYARKNHGIATESLSVLQNIKHNQPNVENVVIPFTDGRKGLNITVNLNKALETQGAELITSVEKTISLFVIDEQWKEHLRQMDDLKQSVQAAVFEQKDPLLIYKFEAFELFNQMLSETNKEILSFLCKCHIHVENESDVRQARAPQRTDMSRMKTQKDEFSLQAESEAANQQAMQNAGEKPKQEPIKAGPKDGRNDPCPCGSGKKYKLCHGKLA